MKARYEAAEASARVSEAFTGASDEMENVGRAIERAEERTEEMEARSAALDELRESGALDDVLSDKDDIDRELESLHGDREVEAELETLRAEMGKSSGNGASEEDVEVSDAESEVADAEVEAELENLKEEERES
jgi:phage shock protein A